MSAGISMRRLLSASMEGANNDSAIPLQHMHRSSTSVSAPSSTGRDPPANLRQAENISRMRRYSTNTTSMIGSASRCCAQISSRIWESGKLCRRGWKRVWARSWTSEICSYTLAVFALAGLIATLLAHQNRPVPQWPQLITINSIVSLFSMLMRTCVGVVLAEGISQCKWNWYHKARRLDHIERLDSASRGSWGSVTLLYHFRPKETYYLAALGAILTIMASFTGFFSQQLIQFRDCFEKDTTAVVTISKCNSYAQTGGEIQKMHPVDFAPMVAAVNVGVTQPVEDLTNVLSSGCISGNCSFPATDGASFSTIAMSRSCTDITAHIRTMNESTLPGNPYHNLSNLVLDYGDNKKFKWQKDDPFTVLISWTNTECKSVLLTIYFVFRSSGNDYNWKATKCAIFPTIDTYGASIRNNILEETLIDSVPLRDIRAQFAEPPVVDHDLEQEYVRWGYKMTTNTTIRNGVRASCEGSENPVPDHVKFMKKSDDPTYVNTEGQTTESAGWKWWYYPRDCIWSIHRFSALVMHQTLREMFVDQEITMGNGHGVEASAHMRQIFLDGKMTFDTVNERMKDLVTSMTAVIRAYGDNGDDTAAESAKGEVWINTTCIYTRWPWAIFPVVMIGLSGLFLMLVVIENRGVEHDRLWKSSFLAALFCEVETQDRPVRKAEMLATAESTSVSLEGKNSGVLRLISH